jgi:hypothetical protein
MINPISNTHANAAQEAAKPHIPKLESQIQTPKSGELSHDQVTLKSAGEVEVDRDGGK